MQVVERAISVLRARPAETQDALTSPEAEALAELYRMFSERLVAVARRIVGNQSDAEDVVHDVFVRLPVAITRYRDGRFVAWLMQVTTRTALMRLRTARRRAEHLNLDVAVVDPEMS